MAREVDTLNVNVKRWWMCWQVEKGIDKRANVRLCFDDIGKVGHIDDLVMGSSQIKGIFVLDVGLNEAGNR